METVSNGKMCPFRERHYCSKCVMYQEEAKTCVFNAINWNLGRIAHAIEGGKLVRKSGKDKGS